MKINKVDINLTKIKSENGWDLSASGPLRIGPKKANFEAESVFRKESDAWVYGKYKTIGFPFSESFKKEKNYIYYKIKIIFCFVEVILVMVFTKTV